MKVTKTELGHLEEFVAELNKDIVEKYGGEAGEINQGNLAFSLWKALREAKKFRRKPNFHKVWASSTLTEIAQSHPFTDGNKRTSYVTAKLILRLGGLDFGVDYERAVQFLRKVASKKLYYDHVYNWIDKNTNKISEEPAPEIQAFINMLANLEK